MFKNISVCKQDIFPFPSDMTKICQKVSLPLQTRSHLAQQAWYSDVWNTKLRVSRSTDILHQQKVLKKYQRCVWYKVHGGFYVENATVRTFF